MRFVSCIGPTNWITHGNARFHCCERNACCKRGAGEFERTNGIDSIFKLTPAREARRTKPVIPSWLAFLTRGTRYYNSGLASRPRSIPRVLPGNGLSSWSQPAVVLTKRGASRRLYLAGDIGRSYWHSQNPGLSLNDQRDSLDVPGSSLTIAGDGLAEIIAWKTNPGFAVHAFRRTCRIRMPE